VKERETTLTSDSEANNA